MTLAKGPSGSNDEYLYNLDQFLSSTIATQAKTTIATVTVTNEREINNVEEISDKQTKHLASLTKSLQKNHDLYFLLGSGSNQHNQLLLSNTVRDESGYIVNAADLVNDGEDAHLLKDIFLITPKEVIQNSNSHSSSKISIKPKAIYAGGGHSALLTDQNDLYLWGWNEYGQLGRQSSSSLMTVSSTISICDTIIKPLDIKVSKAALGHCHTLIIEKSTKKLFCFGDDSRGQVSGGGNDTTVDHDVMLPLSIDGNDEFIDIDAGVFHSAAITANGELITFGCSKFKQALSSSIESTKIECNNTCTTIRRWKPPDGSKLIKVRCGRRHTMILDEYGRIWTMGENKKYGQLGRSRISSSSGSSSTQYSDIPQLVDGLLGQKGSGCIDIDCGWSHNVAIVCDAVDNNRIKCYAWGRSDKSQFGILDKNHVDTPTSILNTMMEDSQSIKKAVCGSEFTLIQTDKGDIFGCGWNEHGNLSSGDDIDVHFFTKISGMKQIRTFYDRSTSNEVNESSSESCSKSGREVLIAAGGAHFLAAMI